MFRACNQITNGLIVLIKACVRVMNWTQGPTWGITMLSKTARLFKLQLGEPFSRVLVSGSPLVTAISVQQTSAYYTVPFGVSAIYLRRLSDCPRYPITV